MFPICRMTRRTLAALALLALASTAAAQSPTGKVPVGWLRVSHDLVRAGSNPTLSWDINYPSIVQDYVTITPPSTVNPKEDMIVEVRVLGAGVTVSTSSQAGFSFVPTEARLSYGGGSYERIFYGTNLDVNPTQVVYTRTVDKNKPLRFGGRYYHNRQWGPYFTSESGTRNVRALVNGDFPPTTYPLHTAPTVEQFIKPYLDPQGRLRIGPMDVIILMELTHTDSQDTQLGYDLQDMVLLVTFKSESVGKNNNGHGNNADGVDSSNPGNAPFILFDTDPDFDDESNGGGAFPSSP
jgi:hypothetical protein